MIFKLIFINNQPFGVLPDESKELYSKKFPVILGERTYSNYLKKFDINYLHLATGLIFEEETFNADYRKSELHDPKPLRTLSQVRYNLLNRQGYAPYCGSNIARNAPGGCNNPRTKFNGSQFVCPNCNWQSSYDQNFIEVYKQTWKIK